MSLSTGKVAAKCARHPWLTIGVWFVVLVLAVVSAAMLLSSALTTEMKFTKPTESEQGIDLLSERLRGPEKIKEIVIVTSKDSTVDDPAFKAQVDLLAMDLIALGSDVVEGGTYYYQSRDESLVSKDRHTTILPVVMAGSIDDANRNVCRIHEVAASAADRSGLEVIATGPASTNDESNRLSESDLQKAEFFGIPVAMIILIVVFGTLVAAGLPLILAGFSIIIAIGITALVGQQFEMSFFVVNMITMMGMAVGIDYSLFVVSRFREELLAGKDKYEAIEIAGSTASRAVLFSGMTVILALAGLLIVPLSIFYSLGAGAIFVVAVSVLAALTLLPAVLGLIGEKINSLKIPFVIIVLTALMTVAIMIAYSRGASGIFVLAGFVLIFFTLCIGGILELTGHQFFSQRIPYIHRNDSSSGGDQGRFWDWITRKVMGRPVISAVLAVSLLLLPALYYFQIETGANGINALPAEFESRRGFEILDREFSFGLVSPVEIVIDGDANSPAVQGAIARLREEMKGDEAFYGNGQLQTNDSGDLTLLSAPVSGSPESDQATGAVKRLRQDYIPRIFADSGADVKITGASAMNLDYFNVTDDYRPIVFIFVLGLSFVLLTVVFHSLVVPLKAIIMNLLSVGAAYGLIVLVFQEGIGASLFGFQQVPVIEAWVPIFLFSVLFGLSMDYHVFLLGRIRENYVLTGDNSESVASGLRSTGRIITGAALIMVAVFSGFASGQLVMFQQMGFGLAVSVLLDATIVRSVLVPATMKLLGDWNWYLPRWLQWLPDVHVEGRATESSGKSVDSGKPIIEA